MVKRMLQDGPQAVEVPPAHAEGTSLTEQASKVLRDVRELGTIAAEKVERAVGGVRERGENVVERGRTRARRAQGDLERLVGTHPFKTMLVALGVGALIGMALRRRRAPSGAVDAGP